VRESSEELEDPVSESSTDNKDCDRFLLLGGMMIVWDQEINLKFAFPKLL